MDGSPTAIGPVVPIALKHPKLGIYSQSLSLFEDVSDSLLDALDDLDNALTSV